MSGLLVSSVMSVPAAASDEVDHTLYSGCKTWPAATTEAAATFPVVVPRNLERPPLNRANVTDGQIRLQTRPGARRLTHPASGEAVLAIPGFAPMRVSWETTPKPGVLRCRPETLELRAPEHVVRGTVRCSSKVAPCLIEIAGCGGYARADGEGRFELAALAATSCELWVREVREAAEWSAPRPVEWAAEAPPTVGPWSTTPGRVSTVLGIEVVPAGHGLEVIAVGAGGPQLGDVLLSIDNVLLDTETAVDELSRVLREPGRHALQLERRGETIPWTVTLSPQPAAR